MVARATDYHKAIARALERRPRDPNEIITTRDLARIAGVTPDTVGAAARSGRLPPPRKTSVPRGNALKGTFDHRLPFKRVNFWRVSDLCEFFNIPYETSTDQEPSQ